jgi:2-oxoglutarate ferredoxin oxidoreductase subunit beta
VQTYLAERRAAGEVPTGLLYVDPSGQDMHSTLGTVERPLAQLPFEELCPGSEALDKVQEVFR